MRIRYLKSSTIAIEGNSVKILTDPWLVDGEYYGSWFHYPEFQFDEEYFNDIDYIYVSHIHPDHFSIKTFQKLSKRIPVLIHTYESKFLKLNIERLGFTVTELPHNTRVHLKNGVHINILAADNCNPEHCARFHGCSIIETKFGSTQIDSLCVIDDGEHVILNTNDCPFILARPALEEVRKLYPKIDFLLVGYGGAGPFPQCFNISDEEKLKAAERKKLSFLKLGVEFIKLMNPTYVLPFAGTYVLGGTLSKLQKFRGVPEIEEAAEYFTQNINNNAQVVLLNTYEFFDLKSKKCSKDYIPANLTDKHNYIDNVLSKNKYIFEADDEPELANLLELIEPAYQRFEENRKKLGIQSDTMILLRLPENKWCSISMKGEGYKVVSEQEKQSIGNFVSYSVDFKLLSRILRGPKFAHWNNAEIGSHITFERVPEIYERELYFLMCFFHA